MDGQERKVGDLFSTADFDKSKDGKKTFVRHDALLRAAKRAFGGIKRKATRPHGTPTTESDLLAVVEVEYFFADGLRWSAVADCSRKTANADFRNYTTALAETRASARALRNALGLEIVTQEEVTDVEDIIDKAAREPALENQKAVIRKKFLDTGKSSLEDLSKILGKKVLTLDQLTRGEATEILERLNE